MLLHITLWTTFSHVSLNIYLIYLKQPWSVLRFLVMHRDSMASHKMCLCWWVLERRWRNAKIRIGHKRETWRHQASSHHGRRCCSKVIISGHDFLLLFKIRMFCSSQSHRSSTCIMVLPSKPCGRSQCVGPSTGNTRCHSLPVQPGAELFSTGEQQKESPEYKKGQNENTFCSHSNPEIPR